MRQHWIIIIISSRHLFSKAKAGRCEGLQEIMWSLINHMTVQFPSLSRSWRKKKKKGFIIFNQLPSWDTCWSHVGGLNMQGGMTWVWRRVLLVSNKQRTLVHLSGFGSFPFRWRTAGGERSIHFGLKSNSYKGILAFGSLCSSVWFIMVLYHITGFPTIMLNGGEGLWVRKKY